MAEGVEESPPPRSPARLGGVLKRPGAKTGRAVRETEAAAHRRSGLGSIQHAQPQQIKVGAAEHAPLDQFESGNLALGLPIADFGRARRSYCCLIAADARSKALEFGQTTLFHLSEPAFQRLAAPLCKYRDEFLAQLVAQGQFGIAVHHRLQIGPLLWEYVGGGAHEQKTGVFVRQGADHGWHRSGWQTGASTQAGEIGIDGSSGPRVA